MCALPSRQSESLVTRRIIHAWTKAALPQVCGFPGKIAAAKNLRAAPCVWSGSSIVPCRRSEQTKCSQRLITLLHRLRVHIHLAAEVAEFLGHPFHAAFRFLRIK